MSGIARLEDEQSRFKPYPAYRDSGVEWLGEIPEGWEVKRFKFVGEIREGLVDPSDDSVSARILIAPNHIEAGTGRIVERSTADQQGAISGKYRAPPGHVIYSKIRPALNKVAISEGDWLCSADMYPIWPTGGMSAAFLKAWMLAHPFVRAAVDESMRVAMPKVNRESLGRFPVLIPPADDQNMIATFLDRQTTKIDTLIEKKQEFLRLLDEERTEVITQAVTKGLNPDAPMKDSGVEWLGEIPEEWEVSRTKFVARLESGHTPSRQNPEYWKNCTVPWFGLSDVWQIRDDQREGVRDTQEKISELGLANSSARLLPKGTVMLSRTASVGFSAIAETDMATTQDFVNWICGRQIRPGYLLYVFRSMRPEFGRLMMGSTHQTIYMPDVGRFVTPVPPVQEQEAIVEHVQEQTAKIDALKANVTKAIALLQEYRTALISAAVTGKIDVRDEVAA